MDKKTKSVLIIIGVVFLLAVVVLLSQKWWGSASIESLAIEPRINTFGDISGLHCCIGNSDAQLTINPCVAPYPTQTEPVRFTDYICLSDSSSAHVCQGQGWGCKYGFDSTTGNDLFVFWCDLATSNGLVECENGCNAETGVCNEGPRTCTEGYEACCNDANDCVSNTYRPDGNVFECKDNSWQVKENCEAVTLNPKCVEGTYNYAYCNYNKYYCYLSGCSQWTDQEGCDCYLTPEQCNNAAKDLPRACYKFGPDAIGEYLFQWMVEGTKDCKRSGTIVPGIDSAEVCNAQNLCKLTTCADCGKGIFKICGESECEQCQGKLNCEWIGNNWTVGLLGKCQTKITYCQDCLGWFMNFLRPETEQCTDSIVYGNNWFAKLIGAQIKQSQLCPIMIILVFVVVASLVLISIPLIKYINSRRK